MLSCYKKALWSIYNNHFQPNLYSGSSTPQRENSDKKVQRQVASERLKSKRSAEASQGDLVVTAPRGVSRAADRLVEAVSLPESSRPLRRRRQSAHLAVLLLVRADPPELRVAADRCVHRVHADHLWANECILSLFVIKLYHQ